MAERVLVAPIDPITGGCGPWVAVEGVESVSIDSASVAEAHAEEAVGLVSPVSFSASVHMNPREIGWLMAHLCPLSDPVAARWLLDGLGARIAKLRHRLTP